MADHSSHYRVGTRFVDAATGFDVLIAHPVCHPDAWARYLDGLREVYGAHEVAVAATDPALARGEGVTLFALVTDLDDRAVGGIRYHGPFDLAPAAPLLGEFAESPERDDLRRGLAAVLDPGALEMKGMWSLGRAALGVELSPLLVRTALIALEWLGAERCYATTAERLVVALEGPTGATRVSTVPVAYPDERYATALVAYDRTSAARADPAHRAAFECALADLAADRAPLVDRPWRALVLDPVRPADRAIARVLDGDPDLVPEGSTRVAYHPWRARRTALAPRRALARLRLDHLGSVVTPTERARLRGTRVAVAGGPVALTVALTLGSSGLVGSLRLLDGAPLAPADLSRLPLDLADVGLDRARVLARRLAEVDPDLGLDVVDPDTPDALDALLVGADALVEALSDPVAARALRARARALGVPVLRPGPTPGLLDVERFDLEPTRPLLHGLLEAPVPDDVRWRTRLDDALAGLADAPARHVAQRLGAASSDAAPSLAEDGALAAALVLPALRALLLGRPLPSGRVRVDPERALAHLEDPSPLSLPIALTDDDDARRVAEGALRAPSAGNRQPWRVRLGPGAVCLTLDPGRSPEARDEIALGAALFGARVAAAALGRLGPVRLSSTAAVIELAPGSDPRLRVLAPALARRATDRRVLTLCPPPLSAPIVDELVVAARAEGATLEIVAPAARSALENALARAEARRLLDPATRHDALAETTDERLALLGRDDVAAALAEIGLGQGITDRFRGELAAFSTFAVLVAPGRHRRDHLCAGQALARVWLTATLHGVGLRPLDLAGEEVADAVDLVGAPLVLVLALRPLDQPLALSPRRPLTAVLDPSEEEPR